MVVSLHIMKEFIVTTRDSRNSGLIRSKQAK